MAWRVLVPIKHSGAAKSRLQDATRDERTHSRLVHAIQLDTLAAVLAVRTDPLVAGLSVVAGPLAFVLPPQIEVLEDAGGGLNAALSVAAVQLAQRFPADGVVVMVGDLPALRPADLLAVLAAAQEHPRSFVRDLAGTGTTLLATEAGHWLQPMFGPDSARLHQDSGAAELPAAESVRADVDTAADLAHCLSLGTGPLTAALAGQLR
ncbi:MAG: 2-phospho-L-lactate guanylyltransferase [Jatrophihabitans sp.]